MLHACLSVIALGFSSEYYSLVSSSVLNPRCSDVIPRLDTTRSTKVLSQKQP